MLVVHPVFYPLSYILPWDPQGQFRSNKLVKSTLSCQPVRNFSSLYPRAFRDPVQFYTIPGGSVVECLRALLYQWGCFLATWRAIRATGLSQQILTHFSDLAFLWISWTQIKIAYISGWKTIEYQYQDSYTGCFKKSFTTLKAYRKLYRGHTQRFELSKCSKTHWVLPRIVIRNCYTIPFMHVVL